MTKNSVGSSAMVAATIAVALLAFVAVPTAMAHGAPEPLEYVDRVAQDASGYGEYGLEDEQLTRTLTEGAIDLLALDVREASLPGGADGVLFLITGQLGADGAHTLDLSFTANGTEHMVSFTTEDKETWSVVGLDAVWGRPSIGDEHVFGVEGFGSYALLGLGEGDEISDFRVVSHYGTTPIIQGAGDIMPGSYYLVDADEGLVVFPEAAGDDSQGPETYTLAGPRELFTVAAAPESLAVPPEGVTFPVVVNTTLLATEQFLTVNASASNGFQVSLSASSLLLAPSSGGRTVDVTVLPAAGSSPQGGGALRVAFESDLFARVLLDIPLAPEAAPIGSGGAGFDSADLAPGASYSWRFTEEGTFPYHDHHYPGALRGSIIVHGANGDNGAAEASEGLEGSEHDVHIIENGDADDQESWAFDPATLEVQVGDLVTWTNAGSFVHRIASDGAAGHEHHGHDHGSGDDDSGFLGIPGPGVMPLLSGIAMAALARRRL